MTFIFDNTNSTVAGADFTAANTIIVTNDAFVLNTASGPGLKLENAAYVVAVNGEVGAGSGSGIDFTGGNDKFVGNNTGEHVFDSSGSDSIKLGGGGDIYTAIRFAADTGPDGTDRVDGGKGSVSTTPPAPIKISESISTARRISTH
jgi:hypothetical protein